ncbi:hypothetical protein BDB01DRAFT_811183 [Pilobolus umbonatus]|nr:hypothetical protein BDB01DRAFT_811183 [Pilobolus umbonatus]
MTHLLQGEGNNPFGRLYQHAYEILRSESEKQVANNEQPSFSVMISPEMKMSLIVGSDRSTQNLPTANEIAAIIPNEYAERSIRNIVITYRGNTDNESNFKLIHDTHVAYMPLHM